MLYSIFIPIYNGEKYIKKLLPILAELHTENNFEIVFVDSSPTDKYYHYLKTLSFIHVTKIKSEHFDHGGTRTLAKKLCSGEIIIYLTQDALPLSKQDILCLIAVFNDKLVGATYGRQLPYKHSNLFGKHLRCFNYGSQSYVRHIEQKSIFGLKTAFLSNSFSAYRRTALDKIGWFKDGLILGEDIYAGAKLLLNGYRIAYAAEAKVYHSHDYSIFEEFKRYFDIGVFHQMEKWIIDEFGTTTNEGMRYIKSEFCYLKQQKALYLFLKFLLRNGMKFLGYKFGQYYFILPHCVLKKLSMHRFWWDKKR